MSAGSDAGPPLARLFAIGYRQLVDGLHDRLRERGWEDVRPAYGFVLLAARERPLTVSTLAQDLGMTKQAASKLAESMLAAGYLRPAAAVGDARVRPLRLSSRGKRLLGVVEQIYVELEGEWADRIGRPAVERLKADLTEAVSSADGSLPAVRPLW